MATISSESTQLMTVSLVPSLSLTVSVGESINCEITLRDNVTNHIDLPKCVDQNQALLDHNGLADQVDQ